MYLHMSSGQASDLIRCQICVNYRIPMASQMVPRSQLEAHIRDHIHYRPFYESDQNARLDHIVREEFSYCIQRDFAEGLDKLRGDDGQRNRQNGHSLTHNAHPPPPPPALSPFPFVPQNLNIPSSSNVILASFPSLPSSKTSSISLSSLRVAATEANHGTKGKSIGRRTTMSLKIEEEVDTIEGHQQCSEEGVSSSCVSEPKADANPTMNNNNNDEEAGLFFNNVVRQVSMEMETNRTDHCSQQTESAAEGDDVGTNGKGKTSRKRTAQQTLKTKTTEGKKSRNCSTNGRKGKNGLSKEVLALMDNSFVADTQEKRACRKKVVNSETFTDICRTPSRSRVCRTPSRSRVCRTPSRSRVCRTPSRSRVCRTPSRSRASVDGSRSRRSAKTTPSVDGTAQKRGSRSQSKVNGTEKGRTEKGTKKTATTAKPTHGQQQQQDNGNCICGNKNFQGRFSVGCSKCKAWFHGACVQISTKDAKRIPFWMCPKCQEKQREEEANRNEEGEDDEVQPYYCACNKLADKRSYVACDGCNEWFHPECVGTTQERIDGLGGAPFHCPKCKMRPKQFFEKLAKNAAKREALEN